MHRRPIEPRLTERSWRWTLLALSGATVVALALASPFRSQGGVEIGAVRSTTDGPDDGGARRLVAAPGESPDNRPNGDGGSEIPASARIQKGTVTRGDTLSRIITRHGAPFVSTLRVLEAARDHHDLRRLMPGQAYHLTVGQDGTLYRFGYDVDRERRLEVTREGGAFQARLDRTPADRRIVVASGRIEGSLFSAVQASGEKPALALMLAELFGWEIDFLRDLRVGDTFRVIVEKYVLHDNYLRYGRIVAAEITVAGKCRKAYLHGSGEDGGGYYHEDGSSVRRQFLKAPLAFSRITSRFTHRRFHPILHRHLPHHGIDYAAPVGTPVRAVGDGRVIKRTRSAKAGRMIVIEHPNGYRSAYLHLSKYARGIGKGSRVTQGQEIGYVGSSGLSTGPHLDFRMYRDGKPLNPLSLKSPPAEPLPASELPLFRKRVAFLQDMLTSRSGGPATVEVSCKIPGFDL